jgi:hypothetical protein
MAIPANYDIRYYRGDTYKFYIQPKDDQGNPISVSAYTAAFTIANYRGPEQNPGSPTRVTYTATATCSGTTISCTIPPAIGAQLSSSTTYVYDVQIAAGGDVYTYLTGNILVTEDVTGA